MCCLKNDPYVSFDYNNVEFKTRTSLDRGNNPIWNQMFEFYVKDLKDEIVFKVWDADMFGSEAIGFTGVKLSALCVNEGGEL